jgi:UDPglucose 6-dehydrogenase
MIMNIGFIGLGKLGMPCAEEIVLHGHNVRGYDVLERSSNLVNIVSSIEKVVEDSEIVFIAVPTPHDPEYDGSKPCMDLEPKDFNYDIVKECLIEANKYMNKDQLLVLISTVLPGTTRTQFWQLVENTRFVYNPYLIAMGSVAWDVINPEMVMIGTEDGKRNGDAKQLINFYETIMENDPPYVVGTWDECECIKVFYNTFISSKISFVNMIQDIAEHSRNINVDVVTDALCLGTSRIISPHYMKAGMGDGGACHPRDNIALRHLAEKLELGYDFFEGIMRSREMQAKKLAERLVELANIDGGGMPIVIHGKAYKPKVPYIDGSYSLLVGYYCTEMGKPPIYVDKYTGDDYTPDGPAVFLLAHSASTTYWHDGSNDELYCEIPKKSIVVDPWRKFKSEEHYVIHYGNTRFNP